jgi:rfaE bifunctional protein nucleotidyltransferase chain/domain
MPSSDKILSLPEAVRQVTKWRTAGDKIVFTNGCFDILHLGHIDYLEKARQLGDRLAIGINSDRSVSRLKGPSRPVQTEQARARMLAALQACDLVVFFEEDTPLELIKTLMPDILVKGDDYSLETIVGAKEVLAAGGKVETVPLVQGYSTTSLIEKIKKL